MRSLLPHSASYAELAAVASTRDGWALRGEAVKVVNNRLAVYAAGQLSPAEGRVEAGVRVNLP